MKKKEYVSPAIQVFEMNTPCILQASGGETGGGSTGSGISQEEWNSWGQASARMIRSTQVRDCNLRNRILT